MRAPDVTMLRVEKRTYSSRPWRIVSPDGRELYAPTSLTNADGNAVSFNGPVCFDRKRDAIAYLAALIAERAA